LQPFEVEVGFASLGFALVAILAFRGSYGMRAAAVIGPDIATPLTGFLLLWLARPQRMTWAATARPALHHA
jgi:hypothetical protein